MIQRVTEASVSVDGEVVAAIGAGLAALVGVTHGDTAADADALAAKVAGLRVFADDAGAMNRSLADVGGSLLLVSQFTLYGDARRGRRPSFTAAAAPDVAKPLVERMAAAATEAGVEVRTGRFGAHMSVALVNDGPVTIILETRDGRPA